MTHAHTCPISVLSLHCLFAMGQNRHSITNDYNTSRADRQAFFASLFFSSSVRPPPDLTISAGSIEVSDILIQQQRGLYTYNKNDFLFFSHLFSSFVPFFFWSSSFRDVGSAHHRHHHKSIERGTTTRATKLKNSRKGHSEPIYVCI